jgi:hypothetical protein
MNIFSIHVPDFLAWVKRRGGKAGQTGNWLYRTMIISGIIIFLHVSKKTFFLPGKHNPGHGNIPIYGKNVQ